MIPAVLLVSYSVVVTRPVQLLLVLALAFALTPALGSETPCPLCEAPVVTAARPWNFAGGIDSDGCGYALDQRGALRVVGLSAVRECSRCGLAFEPGQPLVRAGLREALPAERKRLGLREGQPSEVGALHELAAWAAAKGGPAPGETKAAHLGRVARLWLRAAWAARAEAVLPYARDYAPTSVERARQALASLQRRAARDPHELPAVRRIDDSLAGLGRGRVQLSESLSQSEQPGARLRLLRRLRTLDRLERDLFERKAEALRRAAEEEPLRPEELRRATFAAWVRYGRRARWEQGLAELAPAVRERVQAALRREERRLGRAAEAARAAAQAQPERGLQAAWWFVAGDAARRRGELDAARKDFARAGQGERALALRAEALLAAGPAASQKAD